MLTGLPIQDGIKPRLLAEPLTQTLERLTGGLPHRSRQIFGKPAVMSSDEIHEALRSLLGLSLCCGHLRLLLGYKPSCSPVGLIPHTTLQG